MPATEPFNLDTLCEQKQATTRTAHCKGCTNRCTVTVFNFPDGHKYYIGNKCERFFSNRGRDCVRGTNLFAQRNKFLFERDTSPRAPLQGLRIGIPRILGMFELFPFWNALFTESGFEVVLSPESEQKIYERGLGSIMSDNICFPAKLAHGHVATLIEAGVDRIFYPKVVYTTSDDAGVANTFNCPIVTAYTEVLKGSMDLGCNGLPPVDDPVISFRNKGLLRKVCTEYLEGLGVPPRRARQAFAVAEAAQDAFIRTLAEEGERLVADAHCAERPLVVLAGRPYHADPLVEHKTSEILSDLGVDIVPADAVSRLIEPKWKELAAVSQWTYPNRLLKAAQWVAAQKDNNIQYVMITSFGCGPDAFLMDEIRDILTAAGKIFTLVKVDDIASIGSSRLRLRSLVETLHWRPAGSEVAHRETVLPPPFTDADRKKTIVAPFFADCYSPFIAPGLKAMGYDVQILPPPNEESVEYGLQYANNEVCYPAVLVVGDLIKAFRHGDRDPEKTAVGLTQTGGQCRATSYVSLVKRALVSAGYPNVPVIGLATGSVKVNEQPGFRISMRKFFKPAVFSIYYADAIARMYYRCVVREKNPGDALAVRDRFLAEGAACVGRLDMEALFPLLEKAVVAFNNTLADTDHRPRIAVVGEIYMKFNAFCQMHVTDWMISQNVEVVVPTLMDFFIQYFVNAEENRRSHLARNLPVAPIEHLVEHLMKRWEARFESIMRNFQLYEAPVDIWRKAELASDILSLTNQYGEGWLIPAEIASHAENGINNVVCVQPFGCIANHIVAKGIERSVRRKYPLTNILFLDFDAGTSEVNYLNRVHYMIDNLKAEEAALYPEEEPVQG